MAMPAVATELAPVRFSPPSIGAEEIGEVIATLESGWLSTGPRVKAFERAKGPKKLVTIPELTHYGIYKEGRNQAQRLAIEWFDVHLKGGPPHEPAKK